MLLVLISFAIHLMVICFFLAWYHCSAFIERWWTNVSLLCLECIVFFPYWIYSWSTSEDLDVNNFLVFMFKFLKSHLVIKSSMSISVLASFAFLILLRCQLLIVPSDVLAYTTRSCWFEKQVFYTAAFFDRWFSKKWSWWHWYYP